MLSMTVPPGLAHGAVLGHSFTYQGRLSDPAGPVNGNYDFEFLLFDALTIGNQMAGPLSMPSVSVSGGLFTVELDFGAGAFAGERRWLEIRVQPTGGSGYTTLVPRQELTAVPNALYAVTAATINGLSCGDGDVPRWSGGAWSCGSSGTVTSVEAGAGLSGGPITSSGTLSVNLGGSGVATTVSRTDHNHLGQTWVGSGLGLGLYTSGLGPGLEGVSTLTVGPAYGVSGLSYSTAGAGVSGENFATSGGNAGVAGAVHSPLGQGVSGFNLATSGVAYGVTGGSQSPTGSGVAGIMTASTGASNAVYGQNNSSAGRGVYGIALGGIGANFGVRGQSNSSAGYGVYGLAANNVGANYGVYGETASSAGWAGYFQGRVTVNGPFQLPIGAAAARVLTSDVSGNATWQAPATNGTVTSITAGAGLTGGTITTSGTIAVSFAGTGAASTAARSDHNHFGQTWSGSGTLGLRIDSTNTSANVVWGNSVATSGGSAGV